MDAKKFDHGKPRMSLIPAEPLRQVAQVLTFGAEKYDAHNWRQGMIWSRLLDASIRHIYAFSEGEDFDPESQISHLAHAICNLMFLLEYSHSKVGQDDRFLKKSEKKCCNSGDCKVRY